MLGAGEIRDFKKVYLGGKIWTWDVAKLLGITAKDFQSRIDPVLGIVHLIDSISIVDLNSLSVNCSLRLYDCSNSRRCAMDCHAFAIASKISWIFFLSR